MLNYASLIHSEIVAGNGPVAAYSLGETNGSTAAALVGSAGTYNGTVTLAGRRWVMPRERDIFAPSFSGSPGAFVSFNLSTSITSTAITLEAWVYIADWGEVVRHGVISSRNGSVVRQVSLTIGTGAEEGRPQLFLNGFPYFLAGGSPIGLGAWHHVAATLNGAWHQDNVQFYIDGVAVGNTRTGTAASWTFGGECYIGRAATTFDQAALNGSVKWALVYNYARTAEQIRTHYLCGRNGVNNLLGATA